MIFRRKQLIILGYVSKITLHLGRIPFGWDEKTQQIGRPTKCKVRHWLTIIFLVWGYTIFAGLKFIYMLNTEQLMLLDSLNVFLPIVLFNLVSTVFMNIIWKLNQHKALLNKLDGFLRRYSGISFHQYRSQDDMDLANQVGAAVFIVLLVFCIELVLSCFLLSGQNVSLVSFTLGGYEKFGIIEFMVAIILSVMIIHVSFVAVLYCCLILYTTSSLTYYTAGLKLMSRDPFLHPRFMRMIYRSLQILMDITSDCFAVFLPLFVTFLMTFSIVFNYLSIRGRRHTGTKPAFYMEQIVDWERVKIPGFFILSGIYFLFVRVLLGKGAECIVHSKNILTSWRRSARTRHMIKFLESCPPLMLGQLVFGYIDQSTFLTMLSLILNYTVTVVIGLQQPF